MEASRETLWPHLGPEAQLQFSFIGRGQTKTLVSIHARPRTQKTQSHWKTQAGCQDQPADGTFFKKKIHEDVRADADDVLCCAVLACANCSATLIAIGTRVHEHRVLMAGDSVANY